MDIITDFKSIAELARLKALDGHPQKEPVKAEEKRIVVAEEPGHPMDYFYGYAMPAGTFTAAALQLMAENTDIVRAVNWDGTAGVL